LRATDVDRDYEAVMSSSAMLRPWSQSDWPADGFTRTANLADLERHEREHEERVAFTFTVLDPAAERCLGCVYLAPVPPEARTLCQDATYPVRVGFWVRASELAFDLDRHLLDCLREWLAAEWRFDRLLFLVAEQNARQMTLLTDAGLERRGTIALADSRRCAAFLGPRRA
jgi:hypothetical protein